MIPVSRRTSYCACDANARRGRVRRCDALRDGDEVLGRGGNERETPETAGHAPRRSRGAPGRAATRGTPAPGGGTPRVPTPGTVTDHPTPSRSTSAARGTRVAPNEEASNQVDSVWQIRVIRETQFRTRFGEFSFERTTTPTMSSRTPARSRQALMSPKSATTAGGWRCVPLVIANVTRHDAPSTVTRLAVPCHPPPADLGS